MTAGHRKVEAGFYILCYDLKWYWNLSLDE